MIESLASIEKLVVKLRQKKQEATNLRKKTEKQFKEVRSTERRSSSGLNSIDKKIHSEREDISEISNILIQKTSQLVRPEVSFCSECGNKFTDTMTQSLSETGVAYCIHCGSKKTQEYQMSIESQ